MQQNRSAKVVFPDATTSGMMAKHLATTTMFDGVE
jgi:hypothetical protein